MNNVWVEFDIVNDKLYAYIKLKFYGNDFDIYTTSPLTLEDASVIKEICKSNDVAEKYIKVYKFKTLADYKLKYRKNDQITVIDII